MKNTVFPYIFKALLCPLVLFTSCSMEETAPVEAARNNEIKVNVTASENPVATKTTFDGQTLVWSGNETMSVLIGDENSTSKDKTSSSLLVFEPANCTFTGVVSLGEFDESDMRAVTVPANQEAWVCYDADQKTFTPRIPVAASQIQKTDGVMFGDNFPLSAMITDEILAASRQEDGTYELKGVQLQWACGAIRFNIYGMNSDMNPDEAFKTLTVTFDDSEEITVTLLDEFLLFGKEKDNGLKLFMAIPATAKTINKIAVRTSRAVYTLDGGDEALMTLTEDDIRGNVYQFGLNLYKFTRTLPEDDLPNLYTAIGTVTYEDGTPASGVVISDGFNAVMTDNNGEYTLKTCPDTYYIYYSIPADCEVQVNEYGQPAFYTRYSRSQNRYDFQLTRKAGGKDAKFALFCLADPQCKDDQVARFSSETVTDVKSHSSTFDVPCYGVTLGDIVYSEGNRNCVPVMPQMRDCMGKDKIGMPVFQVIGNHDYTYFRSSEPISEDETSSTFNLKAQREFEEVFGPIDYSWNVGDVHIVCMRNIQWYNTESASSYTAKFTNKQIEWLTQDLAFVPTDKMVILCVHIPFAGQSLSSSSSNNFRKAVDLLNRYKEAHIMSGHTHFMRNEPTRADGIYEHVHAAVSGSWWYSNINGDGSPNGYAVYEIEGNTIKNWYYKGVNENMNSRDYQIRVYKGNIKAGGYYEEFALPFDSDVILANVFNADEAWTVKVYENNKYTGDMTLIPHVAKDEDSPEIGNPTTPSVNTSRDWWAIGYHIGEVGRGHADGGTRSNYIIDCYHMYKYTLKNPKATNIRVEATDRFGRTYKQNRIIKKDFDYSLME